MDTSRLEQAARRYRDAEAALDSARADLQTEAVDFLRSTDERGVQAAVVRITGWSREHLRRLKEKAEMEALRRKVEELSAPADPPVPPRGPSRSPEPQRQAPTRKPASEPKEGRPLTDEDAKEFAALALDRASEMQKLKLQQLTANTTPGYEDFAVVSTALDLGLLTHDEVYAERPVSGEETTP